MAGDAAHPAADAPEGTPKVTPQIAAEAAAWVARLHGPGRTRQMELACLEWQAQSAAHRHAFERCTETWMEVPNAARAAGMNASLDGLGQGDGDGDGAGRGRRRLLQVALAVVVGVGAGSVGWQALQAGAVYRTAVGESQTVVLEDGTRMSLNTDTELRVHFDDSGRRVELARGEAAFEVAKDAARPFAVRAGATEVVALGTVFAVRLRRQRASGGSGEAPMLEVTLVEGRVAVRPVDAAAPVAAVGAPASAVVLQPGERVRVPAGAGASAPLVDRPRLDHLLAWQRSEAVFDGATLADAVAEMNRYSRTPVVLAADLSGGEQRVSGQFRTGDNAAFARALAVLHGLTLREQSGRLLLSQHP